MNGGDDNVGDDGGEHEYKVVKWLNIIYFVYVKLANETRPQPSVHQ